MIFFDIDDTNQVYETHHSHLKHFVLNHYLTHEVMESDRHQLLKEPRMSSFRLTAWPSQYVW